MTNTQQKNQQHRDNLIELLKRFLVDERKREGGEKFISWLAEKSDLFTAPLVLPGTQPTSVNENGVSSYALTGFVQSGLAFYEAMLTMTEFDNYMSALEAAGVFPDSVMLCALTYALDCTSRFVLNPVTGMYEDSRDIYLLPPGIRRSQYILSRFFSLSTEELFAMSLVIPRYAEVISAQPEAKQAWFNKYAAQHPLSLLSYYLHDIALDKLAEKLGIENPAKAISIKF